jgi:hypothetical protein
MSAITYTYKVITSSPENKVMEVEYTAEGYPTMLVGMPLPVNDGDVSTIVEQYAPIHRWMESTAVVVNVPVGTSGIVSYAPAVVTPPTPAPAPVPLPPFEDRVLAVLAKYGVAITAPTTTAP